jgi:hypothetical protein
MSASIARLPVMDDPPAEATMLTTIVDTGTPKSQAQSLAKAIVSRAAWAAHRNQNFPV